MASCLAFTSPPHLSPPRRRSPTTSLQLRGRKPHGVLVCLRFSNEEPCRNRCHQSWHLSAACPSSLTLKLKDTTPSARHVLLTGTSGYKYGFLVRKGSPLLLPCRTHMRPPKPHPNRALWPFLLSPLWLPWCDKAATRWIWRKK